MSYDSETTNIDEIEDKFQEVLFFQEPRHWVWWNVLHRGEKIDEP